MLNNIARALLTLFVVTCFSAAAQAHPHKGGQEITTNTTKVSINVSALEESSHYPGVIGFDFPDITDAEMDYYHSKNWNTALRIPIRWGRVQPVLDGALDPTYLGYMDAVVAKATARGMTIFFDIHDFGAYSNGTISSKIDDVTVTAANFADVWQRIATHYVGNPAVAGYDTMNEWADMPSSAIVFEAQQAAVTAIRSVDMVKTIYLEGEGYSSAFAWENNCANCGGWGAHTNDGNHGNFQLKNIIDAANNTVFSAHGYADADSSGTYVVYPNATAVAAGCTSVMTTYQCAQQMGDVLKSPTGVLDTNILSGVRYVPFVNWCNTNHLKCHIGETGVANDDPNWLTTLDNAIAYLQANNIAFNYWSAGGFFGHYALGVEGPQASGIDTPQVAVLTKYTKAYQPTTYQLTGPARGTVSVASSNFTITYTGYLKFNTVITPNDKDPFTGTPAGGTFAPTSVTLPANSFNPSATFTYTAPGTDAYQIATTNNKGLTDPAPLGYATVSDMFSALSTAIPENIFSFRKVYAPYVGPLAQFRRTSDGAVQDYYPTSIHLNSSINFASVAAWAPGGYTMVYRYDQSPFKHHSGPKGSADGFGDGTPSLADQPAIAASGTNPNGKPEVIWAGNAMDASSPIAGNTAETVVTVMEPSTTSQSRLVAWDKVQNYDFPSGGFTGGYTNKDSAGASYTEPLANDILDPTAWHTYAWRYQVNTAKGLSAFRDGILVQQGDSNLHSPAATSIAYDFRSTAYLGYFIFSDPAHFIGHEAETFIFKGALTDAEEAAIDVNQSSYYGTTTATPPVLPTEQAIDTTTPSAFPLTGVNTSELEFSACCPGVFHVNYFDHSATNGPFYHRMDLRTIREPVRWERLQPTLSGAFDPTYLGVVQGAVQTLQNSGDDILLDIHNYASYGPSNIGDADLDVITNGTFTTDTAWTKGTGVTISGGVANITGSTGVALSQVPTISNGLNYTLTYTITASAGTITPSVNGVSGTAQTSSGTYSQVIRAGIATSADNISFNTTGFTGTVDNVSLKFIAATQADYADLMARLAVAFPSATYPKLNIDMMNEPHSIDNTIMANAYQAGITALRANGFTGYVLLEGTSFASCTNWVSSGWGAAVLGVTDPSNKIIDECHQYFDSDASGTHSTCTKIGSTILTTVTGWANTNSRKLLLGEFGISIDPNCLSQYRDALDYMTTNSYNHSGPWVGYTEWTDGAYALTYIFNPAAASKSSLPTVNMPSTNLLISHRTLQ